MNILHINAQKSWRGGEQQLIYLYEGLKKYPVKQFLFCRKKSALSLFAHTHKIPHQAGLCLNDFDFFTALQIINYAQKNSIHIIHAHCSRSHALVYLALNYFRLNVPTIVSKKTSFKIKNNKKYEHPSIKKIICVSKDSQSQVLKDLKNKYQSKIQVIYDGVITPPQPYYTRSQLCRDFNIPHHKTILGTTSAFTSEKGLHHLVQAFAQAKNDNKVLLLMGEGKCLDEIKKLSQQLKIENKVYTPGYIKDAKLYLSAIDLFILPSLSEGLGSSILDAFLAKTPVLASPVGGIPELVINNQTGKLCDPRNYEQFSKKLSEEFSKEIIDNAFSFAKEKFNTQIMVEKNYRIYQSIINL